MQKMRSAAMLENLHFIPIPCSENLKAWLVVNKK